MGPVLDGMLAWKTSDINIDAIRDVQVLLSSRFVMHIAGCFL